MRLRPCDTQLFESLGYPTPFRAREAGISVCEAMKTCCLEEGHAGPHEFVSAERPKEAWNHTLPTVADLVGLDPDYTGGLSSEDYVRKMRDGDDD